MKKIIYGQDTRVAQWVGERLDETEWGPSTAIGLEEDGKLVAGVVFNMYTQTGICMHVAAAPGKRWLTRSFLRAVFSYPFIQLRCNRVTGLVKIDNYVAQKFDEHLGFVREGAMREAATDQTDMIVYGMLRSECKWIREEK